MRTFLLLLCFVPIICNAKTTVKKKAAYFKLISATTQRTLPGIPGVAVKTETHFTIVWQADTKPVSFFWRGESGTLPCNIIRKTVVGKAQHGNPTFAAVTDNTAHRGDTLLLTPMPGGKLPAPQDVPANATNTLFFKTGTGGWQSFPVTKIKTLPDIVNP